MEYTSLIYGIHIAFTWDITSAACMCVQRSCCILMEYSCNIHGLLMEYPWNIHGILMSYSWDTHAILMEHSWNTHAIRTEVVMEGVRQNGWALQFASVELKRDREVVIEAVRQAER